MSAAELVGDLAVLYIELASAPREDLDFDGGYFFGSRLFRLAVEAGLAGVASPEALATLADAVQSDQGALLHDLHGGLQRGFGSMGRAEGYFYGGKPWDELCWYRSGLGFLADLAAVPIDFADYVDYYLGFYGFEMHEEVQPPPGMPDSHWWWFGATPPAQ